MAAVRVKPIQATKVTDTKIIAQIIREALTAPSPEAEQYNKEASDLLRLLQRKD